MKPVVLPPDLQPHVDRLILAARRGTNRLLGQSLTLVAAWCQSYDGLLTGDHGSSFLIVWPTDVASQCADEEIANSEGSELPGHLTDRNRLEFLRGRLAAIFAQEGDDADTHSMGCDIRLRASDGTTASLCFQIAGGGYMGGPEVEWVGVYNRLAEYRNELREEGAVTSAREAERLSDRALLELLRAARPDADRRG